MYVHKVPLRPLPTLLSPCYFLYKWKPYFCRIRLKLLLFFKINTETLSHMGDMNEIAIANAYATCHNVQDLLHLRGFTSKPAYTKNKRGKSKKRKKDKGWLRWRTWPKNIENNESNKTTTISFYTVCLLVCLVSSTNHPATKLVFRSTLLTEGWKKAVKKQNRALKNTEFCQTNYVKLLFQK